MVVVVVLVDLLLSVVICVGVVVNVVFDLCAGDVVVVTLDSLVIVRGRPTLTFFSIVVGTGMESCVLVVSSGLACANVRVEVVNVVAVAFVVVDVGLIDRVTKVTPSVSR